MQTCILMMAVPTSRCGGGGGGVDVSTMSGAAIEDTSASSDLPPSFGRTREAEQVDGVKARLTRLCARDDELHDGSD